MSFRTPYIIVLPALFAILISCEGDDPRVVAKVGKYRLKAETLEGVSDPQAYINAWIEKCLLAADAEARGLDRTEGFSAEMDMVRVSLLADYLLANEAEALRAPTEKEIAEYYENHLEEFRLASPQIEFAYFSGMDLAELNRAGAELRRGTDEAAVAVEHPGLYFRREEISDAEMRSELFKDFEGRAAGEVMGPMEIEGRRYIFKLTASREAGEILPLQKVRELVIYRMLEDKRYKMKERLLKELKSKYNPTVNSERLRALGISYGESR